MFWVFVIGGFLIYLFFSTKKEEIVRINSQGGFYNKYRVLIDHFMEIPNIQVENRNSDKISLVVKDPFVQTKFTIAHGFEDVSIFWHHQSVTFGSHSLNWRFPEFASQSEMIATIERELELYQRNLLQNQF